MFLYIYIGCLSFGLFYSLLAVFLGGHGGIDSHDIGHGGTDGISPLKPIVIATFITLFGGFGIIGHFMSSIAAIFVFIFALAMGLLGAAVIFYTVVVPMYKCQSNSLISNESITNILADVITPIPVEGLGEVAYIAGGSKYTSPAKSLNQEEILKGTQVVIICIKDNIAEVIKKPEVKL
ncbi:MAG: hypothetical protein ACM3KR_00335 [Deltaproteobacteria bacterium]